MSVASVKIVFKRKDIEEKKFEGFKTVYLGF